MERESGSNEEAMLPGEWLRRRWPSYLLIWAVVFLLFALLYAIARKAVLDEIRHHAMGVAIATAAGIDPEWLSEIRAPGDMDKPEFRQVQTFMDRIERQNPDVRYIYVMRRSGRPGAGRTDYEYAVDEPARDENRNGVIDPDETSNPPGTRYDASGWPRLVEAWDGPTADDRISPDPPYPDLMSGYAPIQDPQGRTMAVVGVDVLARTVRTKLLALRVVTTGVWVCISLLATRVIGMYYRQRRLTRERDGLIYRLQEALGRVKTLSGLLPICSGCKKIRDDKGYWEQLEVYIAEHSEAEFTHSLCPGCLRTLYPQQYENLERKGILRFVAPDDD